jgi:hypothetical protein
VSIGEDPKRGHSPWRTPLRVFPSNSAWGSTSCTLFPIQKSTIAQKSVCQGDKREQNQAVDRCGVLSFLWWATIVKGLAAAARRGARGENSNNNFGPELG